MIPTNPITRPPKPAATNKDTPNRLWPSVKVAYSAPTYKEMPNPRATEHVT